MLARVDYWINALHGQPFGYRNKEVDHGLAQALRDGLPPWLQANAPLTDQQRRRRMEADPHLPGLTLIVDREVRRQNAEWKPERELLQNVTLDEPLSDDAARHYEQFQGRARHGLGGSSGALPRRILDTGIDSVPDPEARTLTVYPHHPTRAAHGAAAGYMCQEPGATETVFRGTELWMRHEIGSPRIP